MVPKHTSLHLSVHSASRGVKEFRYHLGHDYCSNSSANRAASCSLLTVSPFSACPLFLPFNPCCLRCQWSKAFQYSTIVPSLALQTSAHSCKVQPADRAVRKCQVYTSMPTPSIAQQHADVSHACALQGVISSALLICTTYINAFSSTAPNHRPNPGWPCNHCSGCSIQ